MPRCFSIIRFLLRDFIADLFSPLFSLSPIIFRCNSQFDCSTIIRAEREAHNFAESSLIILFEINFVLFKYVTVSNSKFF